MLQNKQLRNKYALWTKYFKTYMLMNYSSKSPKFLVLIIYLFIHLYLHVYFLHITTKPDI